MSERMFDETRLSARLVVVRRIVLLAVMFAIACAAGCSTSGSEDESALQSGGEERRPTVYTVNYPLQYFAKRIAGETVDVEFPAPPGIDPALWAPGAGTVADYQNADRILLSGAGYAKWTNRVSLPLSKLVDTSAGFRDRFLTTGGAVTHAHGPGGEHSHVGTAFTTWIDFSQAVQQAEAIRDAFVDAGFGSKADLSANYDALAVELMELDSAIASMTLERDLPLLASHPVYEYFARRYSLDLKSVLWEPDSFPTGAMWLELEQLVQGHPARWMIWESEPLHESAKRLEQMGIQSIVFDPCGNRPDPGDFMTVMNENVANLRKVFVERR
jgi:zinc transport system substrate-binding protein